MEVEEHLEPGAGEHPRHPGRDQPDLKPVEIDPGFKKPDTPGNRDLQDADQPAREDREPAREDREAAEVPQADADQGTDQEEHATGPQREPELGFQVVELFVFDK